MSRGWACGFDDNYNDDDREEEAEEAEEEAEEEEEEEEGDGDGDGDGDGGDTGCSDKAPVFVGGKGGGGHGGRRRRRKRNLPKSAEFGAILEGIRARMERTGVVYEPSYYTRDLCPSETGMCKLYFLNLGQPGSVPPVDTGNNTSTTFVGVTRDSVYARLNTHNTPDSDHNCAETRHGAGHWVLCYVLFLPEHLATVIVRPPVLRHFWAHAHSAAGKFKRGQKIQRLYGLREYIPCEIVPFAKALAASTKHKDTPAGDTFCAPEPAVCPGAEQAVEACRAAWLGVCVSNRIIEQEYGSSTRKRGATDDCVDI